MIRSLILAFALFTTLLALTSVPALAQTTYQTDQSEEDWRKSRKKRDTSDIFEDIKNSGVFGSGTMQGPPNPVEALPEDSRRHLMKERARVIATTKTDQPVQDAPYKPSEEAKNDPDLAEQEKEAWDVIMTDLKGGSGQGQPGDGPNKVAVAGQGGSGSPSNSTMRGGSSQSVAEILAQIKGLKQGSLGGGSGTQESGGGSGQSPLGTSGGSSPTGQQASGQDQTGQTGAQEQQAGQETGGQSQVGQTQQSGSQGSEGQGQQGQAQQASVQDGAQGQSQSDQNGQSSSASDSSTDASSNSSAQNDASSDSASSGAAQAAVEAVAQARAEQIAEAEAKTHSPEPIGPLDRIKKERSSNGSGSNTSASDFLKKKPAD